MRTLADRWRCDASWVTSLVDSLEERNLVERHVVPTDRRVKTIVLTDAGAKAREAAVSRVYGGIHFPLDGSEGLRMGRRIGALVVARARADGARR